MGKRTLESDFGEAIAELSRFPLSNLFFLKSRVLGSVIDATALRRLGWTLVETGSSSCHWRRCLWFEKRVEFGNEDSILARVATSQALRPSENDADDLSGIPEEEERPLLSGEEPVRVFLRSIRFHRDEKDGLRRVDIVDNVPDSVLAAVETDIDGCVLRKWTSFWDDLKYQTEGLPAALSPSVPETPFTDAVGALHGRLIGPEQDGNLYLVSAERLLVRFVRAAVDPDWDPDATKEVASFPDGRTLSNFVQLWFHSAPDDGASRRFLAHALGRADRLPEPFTATGWSGFSILLREIGRLRESVLAADRALDCPRAGERHASLLWKSVVPFLREYMRDRDKRSGRSDELGWLIRILFEREDDLGGMDGFSEMLEFAIAANRDDDGSALPAVSERLAGIFERSDKTGGSEDAPPTPESFDAVEAAFRRLRDSFGCEEVVRWNPNPEGIALSARVHGLVLRYRVEKRIGKDWLDIIEGWNPSRIQTLTVRILDSGRGYHVKYEGFPSRTPPRKPDGSPFFCCDRSEHSLRYLLAEGKTGALDYDGRNILEMSACCGASFLDGALSRLEWLGVDVNAMAHAEDEDGLSAVDHHKTERRIVEVFRKHGIDSRNDLPEKSNLVE